MTTRTSLHDGCLKCNNMLSLNIHTPTHEHSTHQPVVSAEITALGDTDGIAEPGGIIMTGAGGIEMNTTMTAENLGHC